MESSERWIVLFVPRQSPGTGTPVGPFPSEQAARGWADTHPPEDAEKVAVKVINLTPPDAA